MRTLYIPKSGGGYIEYPAPDNPDEFHVVEVHDDFTWRGQRFDEVSGQLLLDSSDDETNADSQRRAAYLLQVDPLIAEAIIKRALGLEAEADKLIASAVTKRLEIQQIYPKTTEELA